MTETEKRFRRLRKAARDCKGSPATVHLTDDGKCELCVMRLSLAECQMAITEVLDHHYVGAGAERILRGVR